MKKFKISLMFCLLCSLCGCKQQTHTLTVFYSNGCSECTIFKEDFIPALDNNVEVVYIDIDEKDSVDRYKTCLDQLEDVALSLYDFPLTPFIYMENGFGAVGYHPNMKEKYLELINQTIQKDEFISLPSGVWKVRKE